MADNHDEQSATVGSGDSGGPGWSLESILDLGLPEGSKMITRMRPFARELLAQIEPDDVTARMLAVQMIATFSRSLFLSRHANRQKNQRWFELYSIECDRAMTLFRRQVQTLSDLRRPRRTSFTAIRNANIAGQQVVITSPPDPTDLVQDEQPLQKETPALPSQRKRPGRPPLKRPQEPPVET